MKKSLLAVLLAGAMPAACNNKAPEQASDTTATPAVVPEQVEVAATTPEPVPPPPDPALLRGDTFAAYDLLANRPLAHTQTLASDGSSAVVGDGGAPSFMRYIQGNHGGEWTTGVDVDGRNASALRKTRQAMLWVPAPAARPAVFEAEIFNPAAQANKLVIEANGTKLEPISIEPGWQLIKAALPDGVLRAENALELDFASMGRLDGDLSGGAIAKFRLGGPSDATLRDARDVAAAQSALQVAGTVGGAMWHVWALDGARVKLTATAPPDCAAEAVWSHERDGALVELGRKAVKTGDTWIDLGTKGELVRLSIVPTTATCADGVNLSQAVLVLPGTRPTVPSHKPKHVLFWMIDTLRSDHLPIHFETDVQAPNLVKLAAEGASFALSYVQGNESKSSHASLFSGMYPSKHRVLVKGHLKPHHHLLPEAMGDNSYKTYAFISNGYVSEPWGFVQGWDMYRNNLRSGFGIDAAAMRGHTLDWMTKHQAESMFMYVGTIDPHVTYRKHSEFIGLYDDENYSGRFSGSLPGGTLGEIAGKKVTLTDREKDRVRALYKNEISYNDKAFGELRAGLEALGTWKDTMVVVTGDHGDQFWEHGGVGHGSGVHQEVVHVPLIIYYPALVPAGTVVQAGADVLDIYSTILDAIDATKVPADLQGHSLLNLIHKVRGDYPEPAIATHYTSRYGVQMQQWKMISKKGSYEMFDRKADPTEQTDVSGKKPLAERWLADTFATFRPLRERWDKTSFGPVSNLAPDFLQKSAAPNPK